MATPLHVLKTYYSHITRLDFSRIPAADLAFLANLATGAEADMGRALTQVAQLAARTTSVANLAYNFFTGATPYEPGLDYLVSPASRNERTLNSPYYQSFNIENRYINFALNLGKVGEGAAKFNADYGALTLSQAVTKAYTEIFGAAPDAAKVSAILNDAVPNGAGGTYGRQDYFAAYGRDGLSGIGTKAAMVGWLLTEAVKADIGTYAKAQDNFLADLGPDGWAGFHVNLVQAYGGNAIPALDGAEHRVVATGGALSVAGAAGLTDITSRVNGDLSITGIAQGVDLRLESVSSGAFKAEFINDRTLFDRSTDLHLDTVTSTGAGTSVAIKFVTVVRLHVANDSVLASIGTDSGGDGANIIVSGLGRLTTAIDAGNALDASQSAGVNITRFSGTNNTAILSDFDDRIVLDLNTSPLVRTGTGSDTIALYQPGATLRFANLNLDLAFGSYANLPDFEKGVDHLDLGPLVTALVNLNPFVGQLTTFQGLRDALTRVSAQLPAGATGVFELPEINGGGTWIYHQDATVGVNNGDGLIRLVGTGLSTGTGAAVVDIHYG